MTLTDEEVMALARQRIRDGGVTLFVLERAELLAFARDLMQRQAKADAEIQIPRPHPVLDAPHVHFTHNATLMAYRAAILASIPDAALAPQSTKSLHYTCNLCGNRIRQHSDHTCFLKDTQP